MNQQYILAAISLNDVIIQAIGILGMAVSFAVFQFNSRKGILLMQIVSCGLFGLHFFLLGNMTAAVLNFMNIPRNLIFFLSEEKKWKTAKLWVWVFLAVYLVAGILTWGEWYSIMPVIGMLASTASFFSTNPTVIRICQLICSPSWLVNNVLSGSIPGSVTEVFSIISVLIAVVRFDILKQKPKTPSDSKES